MYSHTTDGANVKSSIRHKIWKSAVRYLDPAAGSTPSCLLHLRLKHEGKGLEVHQGMAPVYTPMPKSVGISCTQLRE